MWLSTATKCFISAILGHGLQWCQSEKAFWRISQNLEIEKQVSSLSATSPKITQSRFIPKAFYNLWNVQLSKSIGV